MKIDLAGRTALVTGASRGIGREIAKALAGAGAKVACVATNEELLNSLVAEIGGGAIAIKCDVSKAGEIDAAVEKAASAFGGLDILVNNAGVTRDNLLLRIKEEDWDTVVDTNLKAPFLFIKAAGRHLMRSKAGRVVNISSVAGILGNAGQANYASSKAGLIALTKTAARELGSRAVCVNAVAPGFIKTDMTTDFVNDPVVSGKVLEVVPLKRFGEATEVASLIAFLCSEEAGYITGQVFAIDGGMAM